MTVLRVHALAPNGTPPVSYLTLPFDLRQKSRLRATTDDGRDIAITLERGTALAGGTLLLADDSTVIQVQAAAERVSVARSLDPLLLLRAAYHLGNRHIPLQIETQGVAYLADHVLDAMVAELGLAVVHAHQPFEPEAGAYGAGHSFLNHGHSHGTTKLRRPHDHDHDHDHA
jgi:urease accessory protein